MLETFKSPLEFKIKFREQCLTAQLEFVLTDPLLGQLEEDQRGQVT